MNRILLLAAAAGTIAACGGGRSDQPSPEGTPAMDSAMTAIHDSGGPPDSTVSDTTP